MENGKWQMENGWCCENVKCKMVPVLIAFKWHANSLRIGWLCTWKRKLSIGKLTTDDDTDNYLLG